MTNESRTTAAELVPELNELRRSGVVNVDLKDVPLLAALTVEAGFGLNGEATVLGIQRFLRSALGLLDNDTLDSSAAQLFGLAESALPSASLHDRTSAAMRA